jgi:CBS-domain-containing membrane protein
MAPRAAARLESLGFDKVFGYRPGKQDWLAAGLPSEGRSAREPTIAQVLRRDVPRFGLDDRAATILESLTAGGWEWAAIVDGAGVLLGRLRLRDIGSPDARAADVMEDGPGTYRPNLRLDELLATMLDRRAELAFVTDPDGRLHGVVRRRDIARALEAQRKTSWVGGAGRVVL